MKNKIRLDKFDQRDLKSDSIDQLKNQISHCQGITFRMKDVGMYFCHEFLGHFENEVDNVHDFIKKAWQRINVNLSLGVWKQLQRMLECPNLITCTALSRAHISFTKVHANSNTYDALFDDTGDSTRI